MDEEQLVEESFPLFSKKKFSKTKQPPSSTNHEHESLDNQQKFEKETPSETPTSTFAELGLADWVCTTCSELGMKKPKTVQHHCIPKILAGRNVLGIAETGSGKTASFALPILHLLAKDPYGVFALVITPSRELAYQLAEHFRALGSCLHVRVAVVVGGMDKITQASALMRKPHIVIATPGRIKFLLEESPDIPSVFSKTKFLVLDEADRVLDVGFEEELSVIFKCLPKSRQTLLFSATMKENLQMLLEISANKAYFFDEGSKAPDSLTHKYVFIPKNVKDVYLVYILSRLEDMGVRSVIVFVSKARTCHRLHLLLEELDHEVVSMHSMKSQSLRLSALHRFKSRQVPVLIATHGTAGRGLDIQSVDLVINYDIPSDPIEYVHQVGRTARAGRGGMALSFITQNDIDLVHGIEAEIGEKMEEFECKENEVLAHITQVYKARRVATMKMADDGFEDVVKERKKQKIKTLKEKGLFKKHRKRKGAKGDEEEGNARRKKKRV